MRAFLLGRRLYPHQVDKIDPRRAAVALEVALVAGEEAAVGAAFPG